MITSLVLASFITYLLVEVSNLRSWVDLNNKRISKLEFELATLHFQDKNKKVE